MSLLIKTIFAALVVFGAIGILQFNDLAPQKTEAVPSAQNAPSETVPPPPPVQKPDSQKENLPPLTILTYKNEEDLLSYLKKIGVAKLMANLVEVSKGGSAFDCHQEAHNVGRLGYSVEKEKAFQSCDASCHSGCYHGAMESFLNEQGTANLALNIDRICETFETSFGVFECLHGVGHGVLAYMDYDVPEALSQCGTLKDSFSQNSCYGGLFMENILTAQGLGASERNHGTDWANKTDPYFPCDAINQNYDIQYQCYQMQTSWMLSIYGYNFDIVAEKCLNAPETMRSVCFKSLGRDAAGHTLRNPVKIMELCAKVPKQEDYYDQCITGAVNVIIDFWGPALENQANELCYLISEPYKKTCYNVLTGRLGGLFADPAKKQAVCDGFENEYKSLCSQ